MNVVIVYFLTLLFLTFFPTQNYEFWKCLTSYLNVSIAVRQLVFIWARNLWFFFSLSLASHHQKVIKWQLILSKMMKYSIKRRYFLLNPHFESKKLSLDDFLMMTWERERKKGQQIPRLDKMLIIARTQVIRIFLLTLKIVPSEIKLKAKPKHNYLHVFS